MLRGAWTAQVARRLSERYDSRGLDVLCAHRDKRASRDEGGHVRLGQIVSWISPRFKRHARLAFLDIAVVDQISMRAILPIEVEESKAQPKVVMADLFATLLGDHVTFSAGRRKEDLEIGSWTTLSFLARTTGKGSGNMQLQLLAGRLNQVRDRLETPNASIGQIIIETYRDEAELEKKLTSQTEGALNASSRT